MRRPGVVLRVQTIFALCPPTASTSDRVAVATPDSRQIRLSAVRSAGQHGRALARDPGNRLAALDPGAVGADPLDAQIRVEQLEGQQPGFEPGDHAGLARRDHRLDLRLGRHDRVAGDVAGAAKILEQRGADDRLDQDAQHSLSLTGPPASGPLSHIRRLDASERLADARLILQQICSEQPVDLVSNPLDWCENSTEGCPDIPPGIPNAARKQQH